MTSEVYIGFLSSVFGNVFLEIRHNNKKNYICEPVVKNAGTIVQIDGWSKLTLNIDFFNNMLHILIYNELFMMFAWTYVAA